MPLVHALQTLGIHGNHPDISMLSQAGSFVSMSYFFMNKMESREMHREVTSEFLGGGVDSPCIV